MDEMIQTLFAELRDIYDGCNIRDDDLRDFAEELYENVFVDKCPLSEILSLCFYFEEQMRAEGATIEFGEQYSVYDRIIAHLDRNAKNAHRLYEGFVSTYRDVNSFFLLMDIFDKWLTKCERDNVLAIGKEIFIEAAWKRYT